MRLPNCVLDELAKDKRVSAAERGVYLFAWTYDPATIGDLAEIVKISRNSASLQCRRLEKFGWMKLIKNSRSIRPAAIIPYQCQVTMAYDLEGEYEVVLNRGEFLARKRLDWSLRRDEYVTNARPPFLKNPETGKRLEYDTYDQKNGLATEYDGSQHYVESPQYDRVTVNEQKARDLMKQSLSIRNGVTLLTFTYKDLRAGVLEKRLDEVAHLKRGYVELGGPYAKTLNRICEAYAAKVDAAERAADLSASQIMDTEAIQQRRQEAGTIRA